jgi:hypothetical protein
VQPTLSNGSDSVLLNSLDHKADEAANKRAIYIRTGLGIIISLVRSVLLARLLIPNDISAFRVVTSWVGYFGFLTLGTVDTYFFRGPSLLNSGDLLKTRKLQGVALMMTIATALVAGIGTTTLAIYLHLTDALTALYFGFYVLFATVTPFLSIGFWVKSQFQRQARVEITIAVTGLILGMGGLLIWGLRGLLIGSCLSIISGIWLAYDLFPLKTIRYATITDYFSSIKFGVNQSALVLLQGLINSFDLQVLAIMIVGHVELGVYSFATMLAIAIRTAATSGAVVNQTDLIIRYGNSGHTLGVDFCRDIELTRRLDNALITIFCLGALAIVVAVAPIAFPAYISMVDPLAGLILGIITLRWGYFHAVALMIRSLQRRVMPQAVFGTIITSAWVYISVKSGWSLKIIALAPALGAAAYSALTIIICERTFAKKWAYKIILKMLMLITGPSLILAISVSNSWYVNLIWVMVAMSSYIVTLALIEMNSLKTTFRFLLLLVGIKPPLT